MADGKKSEERAKNGGKEELEDCFICELPIEKSPVKKRTSKRKAIETLQGVSRRRKDGKHARLFDVDELNAPSNCNKNYCNDEEWNRKVTAAGHSIISSVRPRSFKSSLLIGLSLAMHKNHASRNLIDTMSSVGFCVSYEETLLAEASLCHSSACYTYSQAYVQIICDNADHNTLTHDGRGTFHFLGSIMSVIPSSSVQCPDFFGRLKKSPSAANIAESNTIPFVSYVKPKTPGLFGVRIQELPVVAPLKVSPRYFLFFHRKKSDGKVAPWHGFMEQVTEIREFSTSRIVPLPFIYHSPSTPSTFLSASLEADRTRIFFNQDKIFVTGDQPIYWKFEGILTHLEGTDMDLRGEVEDRIGLFHGLLSYTSAINYIMGGSGPKEAFKVL
ncbi:hypothetical protein QAD02_013447 [Eretmocerus hayati]|uniref:Uncharacterized protein n=1 Tax=Eretmocerus hayati TaxID=131215 RepID=A0ACC2P2N2_9HYME|nr:hypothetical protein QAD02_013447 [Eretmocerus hayati]